MILIAVNAWPRKDNPRSMITHYASLNTDTGLYYAQPIEQGQKSYVFRHLFKNIEVNAIKGCVRFLREKTHYQYVVDNRVRSHSPLHKAHIYQANNNLFNHNPDAIEMVKVCYDHKDAIARNQVTNWAARQPTLKSWVRLNPDQNTDEQSALHNILFILLAGAMHLSKETQL